MRVDDLALAAFERRAFDTRVIWRELLESAEPASAIAPPNSQSATVRAIAAGLIELLALRRGETPPAWTASEGALEEPFVLVTVGTRAKLTRLAEESPEPLRKRGLIAPEGFLSVA